MKDNIGNRMKKFYEDIYRIFIPRKSYVIIRIDGKAFHTYTKNLQKPFDEDLINDMNETAIYLCKNVQNCKFAYVQSDEISLFLTDTEDIKSEAWFDNNLQKMCSVSASLATAKFNEIRLIRYINHKIEEFNDYKSKIDVLTINAKLAHFDSRVFIIPLSYEVINYFIWRQQDCVKNSISSVAQSLYSAKELHNKNSNQQQELIFQKGINWNDYSSHLKRGRFITKEFDITNSENNIEILVKNKWKILEETPIFTQDKSIFKTLIS